MLVEVNNMGLSGIGVLVMTQIYTRTYKAETRLLCLRELTSSKLLAQCELVSLYQDIFETDQQSVTEPFQQLGYTIHPCKNWTG